MGNFRTKEIEELSTGDMFSLGLVFMCGEPYGVMAGFPSGSAHLLGTLNEPLVPALTEEIMKKFF